ncbi:MAG: outer membrane beta-barrel protein [Bacteroidetes bacterium]|nr:outer membrane beta-barrel protein [Bacteroidota bacterium]
MKNWIGFLLVMCFSTVGFSQQPVEIGLMAGGSFYNGDLGNFIQTGIGPVTGAFARYNFNFPLAVRANLAYGSISSKDKVHPTSKLFFKSPIFEYSFQIEVFITRPKSGFKNYSVKYGRRNYYVYNFPVTTYVFVGLGKFHFNPKAKYTDGSWHRLQPLCTEGQGVFVTRDGPYKLSSMVIPIGAGARFPLKGSYSFGFEIGVRKTFTDYFDDVSLTYVNTQVLGVAKGPLSAYFADPSANPDLTTTTPSAARGNPKNKDAYMFAFVTLQYDFSKVRKRKSFRL